MTLDKLGKLCLQMLEQASDTNVLDETTTMLDYMSDDTFSEYALNMQHVLYSGLSRYVNEELLPYKEYVIEKEEEQVETESETEFLKDYLVTNKTMPNKSEKVITLEENGKRIFHQIKEVLAYDNGILVPNVGYSQKGSKVRILNYNPNYVYSIIYSPRILYFDQYEVNNIWDIELTELGVSDELAINLKYLVYAELKMEEAPSYATTYRNIFEQYIEECKKLDVSTNPTEIKLMDWSDVYGNNY